jgi:predicted DNA-binding protein (UPF0251 family)
MTDPRDRTPDGQIVGIIIDWTEFDRFRLEGHTISSCARKMGVAKGTLIRRAWERANGRLEKNVLRKPAGSPSSVAGHFAPSPPRRFSWEQAE